MKENDNMGKYYERLSKRLRAKQQVSSFRKVSIDEAASIILDIPQGDIRFTFSMLDKNQQEFYEYYKTKEHYINDKYYVILDRECNDDRFVGSHFFDHPLWNMRIQSLKLEKIHDWCLLQEIKNQIVGEKFEALELYPA